MFTLLSNTKVYSNSQNSIITKFNFTVPKSNPRYSLD